MDARTNKYVLSLWMTLVLVILGSTADFRRSSVCCYTNTPLIAGAERLDQWAFCFDLITEGSAPASRDSLRDNKKIP